MSPAPGKVPRPSPAARTARSPQLVDPSLKGLLDHIAKELAREYVSLMERAEGKAKESQPGEEGKNKED